MMVSFIKENTYFASYPYEVFLYLKYQQNLARAINRTGRIFYACASACESDRTRLLTWPDPEKKRLSRDFNFRAVDRKYNFAHS